MEQKLRENHNELHSLLPASLAYLHGDFLLSQNLLQERVRKSVAKVHSHKLLQANK